MKKILFLLLFVWNLSFAQFIPLNPVVNGKLEVSQWIGKLEPNTVVDRWGQIKAAIDYVVANYPTGDRPEFIFPPGMIYVTQTLDFSAISGWNIKGAPTGTTITIPHGVFINGPVMNFNKNNSVINRNNTVEGIYLFSDSFNGKAKYGFDFSYNNRYALKDVRTARISTEADLVAHFAWEGDFYRCHFSGSRTLNLPSDGLVFSDEANAINFTSCSVDNYQGNGTTIVGAGIIFQGSKGLTLNTTTAQKCDYGIQAFNATAGQIIGGDYLEGNYIADIRLGNGGASAVYDFLIVGGIKKSNTTGTTNGLLIDKCDVYGLTVIGTHFKNDDAIMLKTRFNQSLQDIYFINSRTSGTIYGFRNLIDKAGYMYMDNIVVDGSNTPLNGNQTPTFTPLLSDAYTNHADDFNEWSNVSTLVPDNKWIGKPTYRKTTTAIETFTFTLDSISGFNNQVVMFSMYVKFNSGINVNDAFWIENQSGQRISPMRPLRPSTKPTTEFVKMQIYGLVGLTDTAIKVKILTRDSNIYFSNPELKLGFVK